MEFLRNLFSSLLIAIIVPLLIIYLLAVNTSLVMLNPDNFNSVLNQNKTYEALSRQIIPGAIIELVSDQSSHIGIPPALIKDLVTKSVDKTTLSTDLKKVVSQTQDYLTSRSEHLSAKIDLTPYTTKFRDNLKPAVKNYLGGLAPCTPSQEAALSTSVTLPDCKSAKVTSDQIMSQLGVDQLETNAFNSLPKSLNITESSVSFDQPNQSQNSPQKDSSSTTALQQLRRGITFESQAEKYLLLSLVVLFVLLIVSRLKSLSSIFKWVASAIFSATTLPLLILVIGLNVLHLPDAITKQIGTSNVSTESGKEALQLLALNLETFVVKILQNLELELLFLFAIAVILFVSRWFLAKKQDKKQTIVLTQQTTIP